MLHAFAICGAVYLAATIISWLWGLAIRVRWDVLSGRASFRHVLAYHTLACLIAIDEYENVLTAGNFDETISTRLGIAAAQGRWWGMIGRNFLGDLQANHCGLALLHDAERAAAEAEYLKTEKQNET